MNDSRNTLRRFAMTMSGLVAVSMAASASAGPITVDKNWDLGANGNWHVAGNWDPDGIPNNGGGTIYNVTIDAMRTSVVVNLNASATIADLSITTGDALVINNGVNLSVMGGDIHNSGLLDWGGTGSLTRMIIAADTVLDGGGTFDLRNVNDRLDTGTTGTRLTNQDNLIRGGGQVGLNVLSLTNQGVVEADDPAQSLIIDPPSSGDVTNEGTMRAVNGAILTLNAGTFNNAGGLILAEDASFVNMLASSAIVGGEVSTSGSGEVRVATGTAGLTDVTNTGNFRIVNGVQALVASSLINEATVSLDSTNSLTRYTVNGDVMLSGGGSINLGSHVNNRIDASATLDRLTNVDNTIRGGGSIGLNVMSMTNQALIDADLTGVAMSLDPPTNGDFTNDGTMRASNGGIMTLGSGLYDNSLGVIEALDDSQVLLVSGASVVGGEFATSGTGSVETFNGTTFLTDITNTGALRISNGTTTAIFSSLINEATLTIDSTGSLTRYTVDGDVMLSGGGSINLSSHVNSRIDANTTLDRLTNVDNTIRGGGQVGLNVMSLTNQGLIDADLKGIGMTLDPPSNGDFTNEATMRASNGGVLSLGAGLYDNSLGVIEALDDSQVLLVSGASVVGGEFATSGTGSVETFNGTTFLTDITNTGALRISNGTTTAIFSSLTNEATLTIESAGSLARMQIDGDVTLGGGGAVVMDAHTNARIDSATTLDRLTNVDNTISGGGSIGLNTMSMTNQGVINATHATVPIQIDPPSNGDFTNQGSLLVSGDAGMLINSGPFTTSGSVEVLAGKKLTRTGDYDQTAGTTTANGELEATTLNLAGGILNGSGLVDANVVNSGGSVEPGESVSTLSVEGNYTQSLGSSLAIEITSVGDAGVDYDQLAVTGTASLSGSLRVVDIEGYTPQVGDSFSVLTAGAVLGRFNAVIPCGTYEVEYLPTEVVVHVVGGPPVLGDVSCDGDADLQDAGFLCLQLGLTSADPGFNPQADLDNDGDVDYDDRAIMSTLVAPCIGDIVSSATFLPPADLQVDGADLGYLLGQWGPGLSCADMVTGTTFLPPPDGVVDGADLAVLLGAWGSCD